MAVIPQRKQLPPARKPNQIILSGPQDQVDRLLKNLQRLIKTPADTLALYPVGRTTTKVVLVEYASQPACDETNALNQLLLQEARKAGLTAVRTEPNCTTGAPSGSRGNPFAWEGNPFAWEGNPFAWEGNPFAWEGNPFAWEGNPYDMPGAPPPSATTKVAKVGNTKAQGAALFAAQDAFQRIQAAVDGQRNPLLEPYKGEGVLVALFDSCPTAEALANLPGGAPSWLTPHLHDPKPLDGGTYVDHGLFNASLINFIAPGAQIHLYQVLTGEMFGETAWLITALADFLKFAGERPAVVNLSLGSMCCGTTSMPAVEAILWELVRRGGTICAAAGNGGRSARKPSTIPQAQMPAALPYVIAVAASNRETIRASYSQRGDLAAPGGDTVGTGTDGFDDIIGMGTTSKSGFVSMDCGTSFATPLVAGAATLALSDLVKRGAPQDSGLWRRVFDRLALSAIPPLGAEGTLNTSGLGAGIIQVSGRRLVPNG